MMAYIVPLPANVCVVYTKYVGMDLSNFNNNHVDLARNRPLPRFAPPQFVAGQCGSPYLHPMLIQRRDRTVLKLSGEGVQDWFSGLITNSLSGPVTFAALLTPQGKIIADMFVTDRGDYLLIDTTPDMGPGLHKRLKMYRLRAPIEIEDVSDTHHVHVLWNCEDDSDIGDADPRLPALGRRLIADSIQVDTGDWDVHRLSLGVPDSEWDFGVQTTFPADACMDQMNGVDFHGGCFVGQEVVSRMKRMTTVRKRMRGLVLTGPADAGDKIKCGERTVGQVLHVNGAQAMALVRLDRLREATEGPTVRDAAVEVMKSVVGSDD
jgi:folate-binding protein YgfZ